MPDSTQGYVRDTLRRRDSVTQKLSNILKAQAPNEKTQRSLAKPGKGKGSTPPSQRDPKRVWTKKERQEFLDKQNGKCMECSEDKTVDEVQAHHEKRHADGGKTDAHVTDGGDGAAVCTDCHVKIHN